MRFAVRAFGPVCCLFALVAVAGSCRSTTVASGPPNVLLISIDTLRADRLNVYGYKARVTSPAMDALARDSVLFEHHITASPWTTPSHISLLTGLLPSAHGVTRPYNDVAAALENNEGFQTLGAEHQTLAELLSGRGYRSVAFTGGITVDPRVGFDRGFRRYYTFMRKLNERNLGRVMAAIDRRHDAPFFIFLHTFEVHAPYLHTDYLDSVVPPEIVAKLRGDIEDLAGLGPTDAGREDSLLKSYKASTPAVISALYDGGILSMDRALGSIVERLKARGLYDNTLIVVTSDHGEQLGEKAGEGGAHQRDGRYFNTHGNTLNEENVHIPLIVKLPRSASAGRRVAQVTSAIDVMPTILEVARIDIPAAVQGESLRPLWEKDGAPSRAAVSESLASRYEAKSLRTDRFKYILWLTEAQIETTGRAVVPPQPGQTELYDLQTDPVEKSNLLMKAGVATVARTYDNKLRQLIHDKTGKAGNVPMDPQALEDLKALGYVN